jgi:hypothetical protein
MTERSATWWREPGSGSYSRVEREWRWLLPRVPADVTDPVTIRDSYLLGTTRRLNLYLRADEHALLSRLPAAELVKLRHRWRVARADVAVDELLDRWRGLVLAELEHEVDTVMPALPDAVEVTFDDRFTGAALAAADDGDLSRLHEVARSLVKR